MARILVIDDENLVRITLREALELEGFEVVEAADGEQALELLRGNPPDLVITDIIMPEKEGIETIVEIRRAYPDMKIIAISGGGRTGRTDFLEFAARLGADRTLAKPFSPHELVGAVRDVLGEPQ